MNKRKKEFMEVWLKNGGLIPQDICAYINEVSLATVNRRVESGELEGWIIGDRKTPLVSVQDAMKLERKRKKKGSKEE